MNQKMTAVADEIGDAICRYYDKEYLETLYSMGIVIEDVIFQVLIECCRYAYLKNASRHPLKYYIERDGLELDIARKNNERTLKYIKERWELLQSSKKKSVGMEVMKPNVDLIKHYNRYPTHEVSEFEYWEICNVHDMQLVKSIVERRIRTSTKNLSKAAMNERFKSMVQQYDNTIKKFQMEFKEDPEKTVFSSLVLFTLETKYSFEFMYKLATVMEIVGKTEIPGFRDRLIATMGNCKYASILPDICPEYAHDDDRNVIYPMIMTRPRYLKQMVLIPEGNIREMVIYGLVDANVLANAVQSHISLNGKPMRTWFAENTDIYDWATVFETYDIFRLYDENKKWSPEKIQAIRKMYDSVSIDYKALSRKSSIEK